MSDFTQSFHGRWTKVSCFPVSWYTSFTCHSGSGGKKGFGEEKIKRTEEECDCETSTAGKLQAVNLKASFCMCTSKLAACLDPFFHLNRMQ